MKIVQLTPGAGGMYCGNCLRDNALVAAWERLGHEVCMLPLYLPLKLDEEDQSRKEPIFFGGINVYLEQKAACWKYVPRFFRRLLNNRTLLRFFGSRAAQTHPAQVGELTVSMLRGEQGRQGRELEELCAWLEKERKPDVLCFSNALLIGMHRMLKERIGAKTLCMLSGEDGFLDALPEPHREQAWALVRERIREVDLLVAPSRYFAQFMAERLELPLERIHVIPPGLNPEGFEALQDSVQPHEPTLGYFARMSRDKGLDLLVDAFIEVRKRGKLPNLKLKIGGGFTTWNESTVQLLQIQLLIESLDKDVTFHPNLSRNEKIEFLRSLDAFCVPSRGNEAFALYTLESLAAEAALILPERAAFPEIIASTGGGILFDPESPLALVEAIERMFLDEQRRTTFSQTGRRSVMENFTIDQSARKYIAILEE